MQISISQPDGAGAGAPQGTRVRVGDRVRARQQRWVVTEIRPHEDCSALTLSGLGPSNVGQEQRILTPFDVVEPITSHRSLRIVRPTRWRRICQHLIADVGPAGCLRTARTARMDLLPHQLAPALAIVHGHGSRILIADEVGLGKTVQAALIVSELKSRGAATRVLVLAPAGLREQWIEEFASRFDLPLTLFDMATAARQRASLPVGVNPWSVEPLIVTSIDYIKRPEVLPAVRACRWDIVVVDEAHHAAAGTDRHDAVGSLCRAAPYVVLLSATPHSGDPQAFASLCQLGQQDDDALLVFRRTRQQIGVPRGRRIHQLRVKPTPEERTMHAALDAFVRAVQHEPHGRDSSTWLALATLRKRALSSAFALLRSVEHRLGALSSDSDVTQDQLTLPLFDAGGEFGAADDIPAWTIPAFVDRHRERQLLSRVAHAASRAIGRETKLAALTRLLRRIAEPAIVFTEYRDTLVHLWHRVAPSAAILHGGLARPERAAAVRRFRGGGVLLATDAAGEGLNLHHNCRIVVNLELPWNPMRLEQRIGRVDRIGQTRRVHAFHLIAAGTAELRMLQRLGLRVARAQADLGAQNPLGSEKSASAPSVETSPMNAEATLEHARLTLARQLTSNSLTAGLDRSGDVERHALVTFAKRRVVRSRLGSQVLMVFRCVAQEDSGQAVGSHLIPVKVQLTRDLPWSVETLDMLGTLVTNDRAHNQWISSTLAIHEAFWKTRLARERSIAAMREQVAGDGLQMGLFDLRAEHTWIEEQARRHTEVLENRWATSVATQRATLRAESPRLALVLLTR